ncbi:MAG: AraC family transcriptional regulator [Bacteroidota bacterium]
MKPILEAISVGANSSIKVETYDNNTFCESTGWHVHPEFELVFVRNGSGCLNIGSKKHTYTDGTLVFLGGNIPHADFGNKDYSDNLEVVVQFKKEFLEEKLKVFPELNGIKKMVESSRQALVFDTPTKKSLWGQFEQFDRLDNQGKLLNLLNILDFLSKFGVCTPLFDALTLSEFRKDEIGRLEEIFEYVNNHYQKNISISVISSQLALTPNSFCRFFKKMTKRRFMDFVNEFRISKAVEFFNENNTVIAEVMYNSGFNDASYFTKQFKKYQGLTPSQYLKQRYRPPA